MDDAKTRTRKQILEVAAVILERDGAQAVSTRSVAAAAGIRAASLYQLFGDKDGLLAALAIHAFELYLADKQTLAHTDDPVADMRRGWDMHVAFGLEHPAFYLLMYGPDRPGRRPPAADEAHALLMRFVDRIAAAGRLRVPPEPAAQLAMAAITGVTMSLIASPPADRDPQISARMRDTMVDSLITDPPPAADPGLASRALALDAALEAALNSAVPSAAVPSTTVPSTAASPTAASPTAASSTAAPATGGASTADGTTFPLRPAETALLREWLHQLAR